MKKIVISSEALQAIQEGIERGDSIYELEYLGVNLRSLTFLEDSKHKIIKLEDLLKLSAQQLLCIEHFGVIYLQRLYKALAAYHVLPRRKKRVDKLFRKKINQGIRDMPPKLASNAKALCAVQQRGLQLTKSGV